MSDNNWEGFNLKKGNSKNSFLRELNFLLTLHFDESERNSIIDDYEDFFKNEVLQGKSEIEICSSIEPPKKIVENLCKEKQHSDYLVFFKNTYVKILLVSMFIFILDIVFLNLCKEYSISYLFFALLSQILYLGFGVWILDKSKSSKLEYKEHFVIFGVTIVVFLFESFVISLKNIDNVILYTSIFWLIILGSYLCALYFILKINKGNEFYFSVALHLSGLVSICIYFINELGLLYNDKSEILKGRIECIIIYVVTVLFCMIFRKIKEH